MATTSDQRPRIGLVADRRDATVGAWRDIPATFVFDHYITALVGAGGAPLIVPADRCFADAPELMLDVIDGLLLIGGPDIDAASYGAAADPHNDPGNPRRDEVEIAVARAAAARGLPILGVCRGMQLLNIARGGGIRQHVDDSGGVHRGPPGVFVAHDVIVEPGSLLAAIAGAERIEVRSHHHQALDGLGAGLVPSGYAADGLLEAVEDPDVPFCLGVLWHPEEYLPGAGSRIYAALVAAAATRARREAVAR